MLAATAKIGSKNFVHVDVLQAIRSQLEQLPAKQKTMLELKDAVAFLYPGLKGAVQKNYTKDEILQIIVKEGWAITHNSFRYLWSLFLSEDENPGKKKNAPKSAGRTPRVPIRRNNNDSPANAEWTSGLQADVIATALHGTSVNTETTAPAKTDQPPENDNAKSIQQNSAHFELPPDTYDL